MRGVRPPLFLSIGPADCRSTVRPGTTGPVGAAGTVDCACRRCLVDRFVDCRSTVRPDTSGPIDTVSTCYSVGLLGDGKSTNNKYDSERDASHLSNLSFGGLARPLCAC